MRWRAAFVQITLLLLILSIALPAQASDVAIRNIKARPSDMYSPETAWEEGYRGSGINIAILDTGVDDDHTSLAGKFVAGVDFTKPNTPKDGSYNPDDSPTDGHGTWVAGIAMGTGGSEHKYMGAAPEAKLIDVKVVTEKGPIGIGNIIAGINWCIEHKDEFSIKILSISLGVGSEPSDGSDDVSRAAEAAIDAGLVVVIAAGNDGPDNDGFTPPVGDRCIIVGATDDMETVTRDDDTIADFSNRGPRSDGALKPDVVAPGVSIMSSKSYNAGSGAGRLISAYQSGSGTSASAPMVSGIAALMLQANPELAPEDILAILHETSEARGEPDYPDKSDKWNKSYGYGIVDAHKAVEKALRYQEEIGPVRLYQPKQVTNNSMKLSWSKSNAVQNFSNYEVHKSLSPDFYPGKSTLEVSIDEREVTSYKVAGLQPDTTYYYKIRLYTSDGNFWDSNEESAKTLKEDEQPEPEPDPDDTVPPSIVIESPSNGAKLNQAVITIQGTASDNEAVVSVFVRIDEGTWQSADGTTLWLYEWDARNVNGSHTISARAYDGTQYSNVVSITVTIQEETGSDGDFLTELQDMLMDNIAFIGIIIVVLVVIIIVRRR